MAIYSTDPIADMLTRIRNALLVDKQRVEIPHSKLKAEIAKILAAHKFISKMTLDGAGKDKQIIVTLSSESSPAKIQALERISKPGLRVYSPANDIPKVKNGRGLVILSTSKGIMSGQTAAKAKIGGEVLCSVY